ncbi:MAG: dihydrofolate reductase [Phycisphaerales bacterium]|nr:dihydrofolate reductase [Phycisphaerales bacterium]
MSERRPQIGMIVACSENRVIGREGGLPWHLPDDLRHFMRTTLGCPVIMGRKTFASLNGPLPRRINIVVSRTMKRHEDGVIVVGSLDEGLAYAGTLVEGTDSPIWIAGGGEIYRLGMSRADLIVRTLVHEVLDGDVVFPEIDPSAWELRETEFHGEDDRHPYSFSIEWWDRAAGDPTEQD